MHLRNGATRAAQLNEAEPGDRQRVIVADEAPHRRGRVMIGFAIALSALELTVRLLAGQLPEPQRWSTPETQYKVDQITALGHADVVVVGSSIVDVGLDPTQLGPGAYNAALGAASIGMVAEFTRAVVVPRLDPDVVVIGISSRELNENAPGQDAIERQFLAAPAARQALGTESLLDRADRVLSDVSYLARFRTALRQPKSWFGSTTPAWDSTVTRDDGLYLGFLDEAYHDEPGVIARMRNGALHDFHIGDQQVAVLRRLLVDLRSQGRRVVLVAVPVTQDYIDLYPRGIADHDEFLATVSAIADDVDASFITAGVWDRSLMADPLHANRSGMDRLSALVAAELR